MLHDIFQRHGPPCVIFGRDRVRVAISDSSKHSPFRYADEDRWRVLEANFRRTTTTEILTHACAAM